MTKMHILHAFQGGFPAVSVCQMCVIGIMLFEMYFMTLWGNKPAVNYWTYIRAEVAQGCCAHQHLLSHIFMHKTNVYIHEGQPFTALVSKSIFPFKIIWISKRCESIQQRIGFRNADVLIENTDIQLRFPFFPPHQWKFKLFLL